MTAITPDMLGPQSDDSQELQTPVTNPILKSLAAFTAFAAEQGAPFTNIRDAKPYLRTLFDARQDGDDGTSE